jgi:hypothetical protein
MKKILLLGCLIANTTTILADELAPFTTDGCSLFPNGNPQHKSLWLQCCIQHDMAYWKGGTRPERLAADLALEQCVNDLGEPEIARIMLAGVRAGGTPYLPSSYRWGYGWSLQRGYLELNPEEKAQLETRLQSLESLIQATLGSIKNTPVPNPETPAVSTQNP